MEFEISGNKRTNKSFLESLFEKSIFENKLDDSVSRILNTFSNTTITQIDQKKFKVVIDEFKRKFNLGFKTKSFNGNGSPVFTSLLWPNLFGNGEILNFEIDFDKNLNFIFQKPLLLNNIVANNIFFEAQSYKKNKKVCEKDYNIVGIGCYLTSLNKNLMIGTFYEKISKQITGFWDKSKTYIKMNLSSHLERKNNINLEAGVYSKKKDYIIQPYLKILASYKILTRNFFNDYFSFDSLLKTGFIFGNINFSDRFFLGSDIPGYKNDSIGYKNGGKSFISTINKINIHLPKNAKIYWFYSSGLVSKRTDILDLVRSFLLSNLLVSEIKNIGSSFGCGITLELIPKMPKLDLKICKTLVTNEDTKVIDISFDF